MVSSILGGASSATQLEENLGSTAVELDADDLAQLDAATRSTQPYPQWFTERVAGGKVHDALGIKLSTPPVR